MNNSYCSIPEASPLIVFSVNSCRRQLDASTNALSISRELRTFHSNDVIYGHVVYSRSARALPLTGPARAKWPA